MSRLTKCNKNRIECNIGHCPEDCNTCGMFNDIRKKLSHYEDLEKQGRLIELPCKVGDTVWLVEKNFPQYPPIKFKFSRKSDIMREMEKGMIFEKTKEEAEAKLKELREGAE